MATYKQPQKMAAQPAGVANNKQYLKDAVVSVGTVRSGDLPGVKSGGIKIRGTGAATKGTMARGPMA